MGKTLPELQKELDDHEKAIKKYKDEIEVYQKRIETIRNQIETGDKANPKPNPNMLTKTFRKQQLEEAQKRYDTWKKEKDKLFDEITTQNRNIINATEDLKTSKQNKIYTQNSIKNKEKDPQNPTDGGRRRKTKKGKKSRRYTKRR